MKAICLLPVFFLAYFCSCSYGEVQPPKPNVTETFLTWMIVNVEYFMDKSTVSGTGYWGKIGQEGKQVVNVTFQNTTGNRLLKGEDNGVFVPGQTLFQLQRCDLNSTLFTNQIQNDTTGNSECDFYKDCAIIDMWGWLDNATYQGRKEFINEQVDVWEGQISNYTTVLLGVSPNDPNLPVIFQETDVEFGTSIGVQFIDFLSMEPPKSVFDVPLCSKNIKKTRKKSSSKLLKKTFNFLL